MHLGTAGTMAEVRNDLVDPTLESESEEGCERLQHVQGVQS